MAARLIFRDVLLETQNLDRSDQDFLFRQPQVSVPSQRPPYVQMRVPFTHQFLARINLRLRTIS